MARTIQKPGMYCEQCDRPISAQKNKHGARNTFAVVTLTGLGAKVEGWHCPNCGGPAISVGEHERNLRFGGREPTLLDMIKGPASVAETGEFAVRIDALPRPAKGPKAWSNLQAVSALAKALGKKTAALQTELEQLPYLAAALTEPRARGIAMQFGRLGGKATVVEPASSSETTQSTLSKPSDSTKSIVQQIKDLGELKEAGLLTDEEFERKKTELLDRM